MTTRCATFLPPRSRWRARAGFLALLLALVGSSDRLTAASPDRVHTEARDLVMGHEISLRSRHLETSRRIFINLPDGYDESSARYPVVYLLDGQLHFPLGVGFIRSFRQFEKTPELIVVGIESQRPQRFRHFSSGAESYTAFLEDEVIAYVDRHFRTAPDRLIFGWEYGGSFVLRLVATRPRLFDAYVVGSPFPIGETLLDGIARQGAKRALDGTFVHVSVGDNEGTVEAGVAELTALLRRRDQDGLVWRHEHLVGEQHTTTAHRSLHRGLLTFYADYAWLRFNTLEEFDRAGGLTAVEAFYVARAVKYGEPSDIHRQTMHNLARMAWEGGDPARLAIFLDAFEGFVQGSNHGWCNNFAELFLDHGQAERARAVLESVAGRFPRSARLHGNLGRAHQGLGDTTSARASFETAVAIAEANDDPALADYRAHLKALSPP